MQAQKHATLKLTEASAWAGAHRLFAFMATSPISPDQTLLVLHDGDVASPYDQWALIDGEFNVRELERPAASLEERFGRIAGGALAMSASEGAVSLRAAFSTEWELHFSLRGRRMATAQGGNGRWSIGAHGLGDLRDLISCLRGLGEADMHEIGSFDDPGIPLFQLGGPMSEGGSVITQVLAQMADDGARAVAAVLGQMGAAKSTETVACNNCGHDFTRRSNERWKIVCRACFANPARVRESAQMGSPTPAAERQAPVAEHQAVVTERVLIERIDACLLPHGLKLRRGVLVPFVVIRIGDGTIARSKIMDLEALGRGFRVLQPHEHLSPRIAR